MNVKDQVDHLIKEIASENGVAVSRDDPIMVLLTINNHLLKISAQAHQEQLDQYKAEMEDFAKRWGNNANDKAERILNASLAASKEAINLIMQDGVKTVVASMYEKINDALACGISYPIREARRICFFIIATSLITLLAAVITLWVTFR